MAVVDTVAAEVMEAERLAAVEVTVAVGTPVAERLAAVEVTVAVDTPVAERLARVVMLAVVATSADRAPMLGTSAADTAEVQRHDRAADSAEALRHPIMPATLFAAAHHPLAGTWRRPTSARILQAATVPVTPCDQFHRPGIRRRPSAVFLAVDTAVDKATSPSVTFPTTRNTSSGRIPACHSATLPPVD